ncbi:hypothetical protein POTOM_051484 [Populus tomentosa]|uniref:Glycolipid transfer protein domain-containing protein n=1 Tax=Populus tomentosa TaxID=118781 RepID=A0A8X8C6Z5_POPTO|nr:hypothetical protein POTOM_051484 [Populus tomentosa]
MGDLDTAKPLRKIAEAFKELEATINSQSQEVEVAPFSHACSLVSPLFGCLGIAFKFAEVDYVAKVLDLAEASKSIGTLQSLLEKDIQGNSVRKSGSHSRNLLRVKRGLVMVKVLFELILVTESIVCYGTSKNVSATFPVGTNVGDYTSLILAEPRGDSLKGPASKAYEQVFAPHHGWALRKAVAAGMYALPTKAQLLNNLNEDGECLNHFKRLLMKFIISQVPERKLSKHSNAELCCCIGAGNNVRRETLPNQRIGSRLVNNGLLLKSLYCDCPFSFLHWSKNINILTSGIIKCMFIECLMQ